MAKRSHERTGGGGADSFVSFTYDRQQFKALKTALRNSGPAMRRSVRARLKKAGEIVRDEIKSRTPVRGGGRKATRRVSGRSGGREYKQTRTPGLLKRSTRIRMGTLSVAVYNNAKAASRKWPAGYRYGKRIEFDPDYDGRYAFFYPGWEAKKSQASEEFKKVLDDVAKEFGRG